MSARTTRLVAGCAAAGSLALMAGGLILAYLDRHLVPASLSSWDISDVFGNVVNMAIPVMGFVLASRRPQNRIGWLALAAGLTLGLSSFAGQYGQRAMIAAPRSWPAGPLALWAHTWIWPISLAMVAFMFLLFPTGRLRSRRWQPAAWFTGAVFTLTTAALIAGATRQWAHPFASFSQLVSPPVQAAMAVGLLAALAVSGAAIVVRFARSAGEERLQLKWFVPTGGGPRQPARPREATCQEVIVSQVRVHNFSVSLDGFGTGEGQSLEAPFGHAGTRLHEWFFPTRTFRAMQGQPGGSTGVDDAFARAWAPGIGAEIMGGASSARSTGPGRTRSGTDGGVMTRRSAPRSLFSPTIPGPLSR